MLRFIVIDFAGMDVSLSSTSQTAGTSPMVLLLLLIVTDYGARDAWIISSTTAAVITLIELVILGRLL